MSELPTLATSVDYITVTTKTRKETAALLHTAVQGVKEAGDNPLAFAKDWSFHGFKGKSWEGVRYGVRGEEGIVMLSGPDAQKLWRLVAPSRSKCTRIDLQCTMTLPDVDEGVARRGYQEAQEVGRATSTYYTNSTGGKTLYLGSRTSMYFGRLYDKGAQQGGEGGRTWRYEVEVKKPSSEALVTELLVAQDVPEFIRTYVQTWFAARGINCEGLGRYSHNEIEICARVSSAVKSLQWLSTSVRPTVGKLMAIGMEKEVYEALGLPSLEVFSKTLKEA